MKAVKVCFIFILLQIITASPAAKHNDKSNPARGVKAQTVEHQQRAIECSLDPAVAAEIAGYQDTVNTIIQYVMDGQHKGVTYDTLADFLDHFGNRQSGSTTLDDAIDWVVDAAQQEGFDAVTTEAVEGIPHWLRNEESAEMIEPRHQKLNILSVGTSVGTPPEGITAEIIVVTSFDELAAVADQVPGKIVVYNQGFESYGQSYEYRTRGASEAAKVGALAALVMSAASFSIGSPHTGSQQYEEGVPQIPAACLSVEDAGLLYRLYTAGNTVRVNLTMGAQNLPTDTSRNTLIDYNGYESPQSLVVVSGHIDSWDVGTGAMDDAGGCFVSYHAVEVLKRLGLRARRTVRTIWFTGEELGIYGGDAYYERHRNESENYQILMESDAGTFTPYGIGFFGSDGATCIMQAIVGLTGAINTTELVVSSDGPDIDMWPQSGVPIGSLHLDGSKYFWFHHTDGDTLDVEDRETLDRITALWASVAYVAADISVNLQEV